MSTTIQRALEIGSKATPTLTLSYNNKQLTVGEKVDKDVASTPPRLALSVEAHQVLAVGVDIDAPFPSAALLSPILHWIQPSFAKVSGGNTLEAHASALVDWLQPTPPPFSGPHRYVIILFKQPESFDSKAWTTKFSPPVGVWPRTHWDIEGFVQEAGLGDAIAANWFNV
ncbi:putative protease inhibitor [Myriangium duriaei CBS 260.36]|uniref:Protease inhibitor n=1 Tax=Myriangium duriaei CBS 260.36 TaxID=1168546 RepID=A0A9P4IVK0_9PEZI|nr:putative protease inhibitor [Myriangium duriaei CBS 260.36]